MKLTRSNGKKEKRKWRTCPLLGNMLDITSNMLRFDDWISEQCAEFNNRAVDTVDSGKEPWIVVSPVSQYQSFDVLGNGLSVSDGDAWFCQRKTASQSPLLHVNDAEDTKELSHFTMDVFSKIGFGVELDTLKDTFDREEDHEFLEAFDVASVVFGVRIQTPTWLWELKKFLNVGWEKILMDNCKNFHDFIDSFILKAIEDRREKGR
ncbi:Cytochrome P450 [Phytophthora cactorum]|nr:Cytochrome P450 [Phytophthora cactorum]